MNKKRKSRLWLCFTGVILATLCSSMVLAILVWRVLFRIGLARLDPFGKHVPVLPFLLASLLLGAVIAVFVGKLFIRPIQDFIGAFDELSQGNFAVKVPENEKIAEIREMARRFNAMTYDLSHIETLRSDFVANVSHEFKTPIASIEGYATLLQDPELSSEKHGRYVEKILENSRRLSGLSSNILALSKLENQETVMDKREFRLDEQIRKSILLLESKWAEKGIEFDMELPKLMFYGSELLLSRVWANLLDNAIKYSPQNGIIRVTLQRCGQAVSLSITDQGPGMTEEVQRHIFEKFYQGDPSRRAEGNGLGLALVKRIVELCRGSIELQSAPGEGATFVVMLSDEEK